MKKAFIEKNFNKRSLALIEIINEIMEDYDDEGYDLSLRQLYYQLVARNIVENTERSYKNIGALVSDARLAGHLDWSMIQDRARDIHKNPHWENPRNFMEEVAPQYRHYLWKGQENYVEVMVEKQALEGVLIPVCERLDVTFQANKGYSSSSALYLAAKRFVTASRDGKNLHIIYLGDHDPSGIDMTRDILDRMNLFVGQLAGEEVEVHRAALNMAQIDELRPPKNPAKLTDTRADDYVRKFGESSWELDAIEPRRLAKLVEDAIRDLMDKPLFDRLEREMMLNRSTLKALVAEHYGDDDDDDFSDEEE